MLVLAPSGPGLDPRDTIDGIAVERFRYAPLAWETLAYEGTMAEQVRASIRGKCALLGLIWGARRATAQAIRRFQPDVVHAHWWFPLGLAVALAPSARPLVITMHGSDVRLAIRSPIAQRVYRWVVARARAVTSVSNWLAQTAGAFGSDRPIQVAPMPVDVARFPEGGAARTLSVLFVGRLNAQKGVRDLIDALAQTQSSICADIVGAGPDREWLVAHAQRAGVADRVRWHGALSQEQVGPLYRSTGAVVIPSRDEGLGLVAAEALLSGARVIAYRSGGLPDLVGDDHLGTLVDPGDIAALARAIDSVVTTRNTLALAARRSAGRERMLVRFAPAEAAKPYLAIYAAVTAP